jgi:hypothetical protein
MPIGQPGPVSAVRIGNPPKPIRRSYVSTSKREASEIKLGSVASNALGVSGRAMIEALIAGERDPTW